MAYDEAYQTQLAWLDRVLAARGQPDPLEAVILTVEHDAVITISRRAGAESHLLATPEMLARAGVTTAQTDRGGDITYHGPGQLVVYPVVDLNRFGLGLHSYMRLLEDVVIAVCGRFGIRVGRDETATGVWTLDDAGRARAKICAMGVRVKRWISMHGLALNVTTDLSHFDLIVPCGLAGRAVTSMQRELGEAPPFAAVRDALTGELAARLKAMRPAPAE